MQIAIAKRCLAGAVRAWLLTAVCSLFWAGAAHAAPKTPTASDCEGLLNATAPTVQITTAQAITGGSFTAPGSPRPMTGLPAFCRIAGFLHPSADSNIGFEVWLPLAGWNGRYEQVGNGGFAGNIVYAELASGLTHGFVSANTDDGHQGGDMGWMYAHPEKVLDFGYRSVHGTADAAKALVKALYGQQPDFSYFVGCSEGGREGLMEAQRYPEDFNGIIAGDPAQSMTHLIAEHTWNKQAMLLDPARTIPAAKADAIQAAVLAACDTAGDNVEDGVVGDPRACRFDPKVLLCKGADSNSCLTAAQVQGLILMYAGAHNPKSGVRQFAGFQPGSESDGDVFSMKLAVLGGPKSIDFGLGAPAYGALLLNNPAYDGLNFDFAVDVDRMDQLKVKDETLQAVFDADDPAKLKAFLARGGKLIQYHGWADFGIAPYSALYYQSAMDSPALGKSVDALQKNYRLFMVPGMHHCSGGPGPNAFGESSRSPSSTADADHDIVLALQAWVEHGKAPEQIIAAKYKNDAPAQGVVYTRPLCAYPRTARYTGSGDKTDAKSFACVDEHLSVAANPGLSERLERIKP